MDQGDQAVIDVDHLHPVDIEDLQEMEDSTVNHEEVSVDPEVVMLHKEVDLVVQEVDMEAEAEGDSDQDHHRVDLITGLEDLVHRMDEGGLILDHCPDQDLDLDLLHLGDLGQGRDLILEVSVEA